MTKIPFEQRYKLSPAEGEPYLTQPGQCSNPFCDQQGADRHHLVRRSELGGPYDWVLYDGVKIGNVCLLCRECHRKITENKAEISWSPFGRFDWHEGTHAGRLSPHPPIGGTPDVSGVPYVEPMLDVCPTCHRPHRKNTPHEKTRQRKAWAIYVPKDERENGAEVLDTLLDESRKAMAEAGLPYGDEDNARYFILSAVLALFVQNAHAIMGDG